MLQRTTEGALPDNRKPVIVVEPQKVRGMSIALVAEQVIDGFVRQGVDVDVVESTSPALVKQTFRRPVVVTCPGTFFNRWRDVGRYLWPSAVVSLFSANWQDYPVAWHAFYLTSLLEPPAATKVLHVSHSEATDDYVRTTVRELFNASLGRELLQSLACIQYGVDMGFTVGAINDVVPGSSIAPFNRVNQGQKNINLHADLTRAYQNGCAAAGLPVQKTAFYHVDMPGKDYSAYEDVYDLRPQPESRDVYKASARTFEQFLCTANYESFGIYYLELMLSGVVGVFVNKSWVYRLLPGYDLIVPPGEAAAAMLHVRRNIGEYRKRLLETTIPDIRKAYAIDRFQRHFVDRCMSHFEVNCKGSPDGTE
jgi:hypothetical protein